MMQSHYLTDEGGIVTLEATKTFKEHYPNVRNKYARNPAKLAVWRSASHIERTPQRAKQPAPPKTPGT